MATIYDLAKALNLSVSTTSKALNGYADVSEDTRRRVLKMAEEMQFRPNISAQMLVTKRSYMIGVLFVDFENKGLAHPHFADILESFKREVERAGYQLMFLGNQVGPSKRSLLEVCEYRSLDAVLVMAADYDHPQVSELLRSQVRCVLVDFSFPGRPSILSDNRQGVTMLVDYLYGLGHRELLHIAAPRSTFSGKERADAFLSALQGKGLSAENWQVIEAGGFRFQDGYAAMERILSRGLEGTAVLCNCDALATGAIYCLTQHGLSVPQDWSVTGFDNISEEQMSLWQLTTIAQPREQIGQMAAMACLDLIDERPTPVMDRRLPVSMVVRRSCAAPR